MATTIYKEFTFDAAHHLGANVPEGHHYGRVHGHSFYVIVSLTAPPQADTGWVVDFAEFGKAVEDVRLNLDHQILNEVEGLESPTLENIARWIWDKLSDKFDMISQVEVKRPSCFEGCIYTG